MVEKKIKEALARDLVPSIDDDNDELFVARTNTNSEHYVPEHWKDDLYGFDVSYVSRSSDVKTMLLHTRNAWELDITKISPLGHYLIANVGGRLQSPERAFPVITMSTELALTLGRDQTLTCQAVKIKPYLPPTSEEEAGEMESLRYAQMETGDDIAGFHVIGATYEFGFKPVNVEGPAFQKGRALHIVGVVKIFSNDIIINPRSVSSKSDTGIPLPYGRRANLAYSGFSRGHSPVLDLENHASGDRRIDSLKIPCGCVSGIGGAPGSGKSAVQKDLMYSPAFEDELSEWKRVKVTSTEASRRMVDDVVKMAEYGIDSLDFIAITPAQLQMVADFYISLGDKVWIFLDSFKSAESVKPYAGFAEQTKETGWSSNATANMKMATSIASELCSITFTYPFDGKVIATVDVIWSFFNAGIEVALYLGRHGYLKDVRYATEGFGPFIEPMGDLGRLAQPDQSPTEAISSSRDSSGFKGISKGGAISDPLQIVSDDLETELAEYYEFDET